MHYGNGRPANENDPVIFRGYDGGVRIGRIHQLHPACDTCNCTVAEVIPGGVAQNACMTVGNLFHAEDAIKKLELNTTVPAAQDSSNTTETPPADADPGSSCAEQAPPPQAPTPANGVPAKSHV